MDFAHQGFLVFAFSGIPVLTLPTLPVVANWPPTGFFGRTPLSFLVRFGQWPTMFHSCELDIWFMSPLTVNDLPLPQEHLE